MCKLAGMWEMCQGDAGEGGASVAAAARGMISGAVPLGR